MRTTGVLAAGLAAALLAVPPALAGEPAPEIAGARYSVAATGPSKLATAGSLEVGRKTRIGVRASVLGASFVADALSWELSYVDARKTLVLSFKVKTTSDPGVCPAGARGTVTAVDDDRRLENGRTRDSVRVRFNGGKCRAYALTWANAGRERRARVEIDVAREP
jgi:hypothetical protein